MLTLSVPSRALVDEDGAALMLTGSPVCCAPMRRTALTATWASTIRELTATQFPMCSDGRFRN